MARLIDSGPGCPTPTPLRAKNAAEARGLAYTDEIKAKTDDLYPLVSDFITPMEWPAIAPLVAEINRLKEEKNAVILAHNYMTPDIFRLVGDFRGDSLQLAREAAACFDRAEEDNITLRTAAYTQAIGRIAEAMTQQGTQGYFNHHQG